jgi:hypothetical protein
MCTWGTDKIIHVIRRNNDLFPDGWHPIAVDACIADYVQLMNDRGIITVGCCCGHFKSPSVVLVADVSKNLLEQYGYSYQPYEFEDVLIHHIER